MDGPRKVRCCLGGTRRELNTARCACENHPPSSPQARPVVQCGSKREKIDHRFKIQRAEAACRSGLVAVVHRTRAARIPALLARTRAFAPLRRRGCCFLLPTPCRPLLTTNTDPHRRRRVQGERRDVRVGARQPLPVRRRDRHHPRRAARAAPRRVARPRHRGRHRGRRGDAQARGAPPCCWCWDWQAASLCCSCYDVCRVDGRASVLSLLPFLPLTAGDAPSTHARATWTSHHSLTQSNHPSLSSTHPPTGAARARLHPRALRGAAVGARRPL